MINTMQTHASFTVPLQDPESSWAHVTCQRRDPAEAPEFTGFLHTATENEHLADMRATGNVAFATLSIDEDPSAYWLEAVTRPTPPGLPCPVPRPALGAA